MQPWQTISDRLLAKHQIVSASSAECRVGPVEDVAHPAALEAFGACADDDLTELIRLSRDPLRRLALKLFIFATKTAPEPLFDHVVSAAIMTKNPSFNKHFVFPLAIIFGRRRVFERLLSIFTSGSDLEKCGVSSAVYWCSVPREHMYWPHETGRGAGAPPPDAPVHDLHERFEDLALREFLNNPALDVRRSLVHLVTHAAKRVPRLGAQAIDIARAHSDEYIRSRIVYDLGERKLMPCKPALEFTDGL